MVQVLSADSQCAMQHLTDLDDDCLINVFTFLSPLPDLISLSKACRVSARSDCLYNILNLSFRAFVQSRPA